MKNKIRLDVAVHQGGYAPSREKARAMIMAGEVFVDGNRVDKPGTKVNTESAITVKNKPRFVSRGGEKLAGALHDFSYDPKGMICADVGASTGGFTDCLLQLGAKKIYAIDVGYGQIDYQLRIDPRVIVMERTNARYVEKLDESIDLVVIDASFISLTILLPAIVNWLQPNSDIIALIKPQFEAGKKEVGKGGVVRDKDTHRKVLENTLAFSSDLNLKIKGLTKSVLKGPSGNIEFLVWLRNNFDNTEPLPDVSLLIDQVMEKIE